MNKAVSLGQALRRAVHLRGKGLAVIDGAKSFTWEAFSNRVARLAGVFASLGLAEGGRVVLLSLNSHYSLECFFAAIHAGGAITPLNHRLSLGELRDQVADCQPDVIVLGPDFCDLGPELQAAAGSRVPLLFAGEGDAPDGMASLESLMAASKPLPDQGRCGDDLAVLMYTSGTTSAAKGVMLSHANFVANTANTYGDLGFGPDIVHLHHGPLFHVAAAARVFSVTHAAGTHVLLPRFVAGEVIAAIQWTGVTHATFVPTMLRAMLDDPALIEADLSSLRVLSYGSAPMPEALLRELMAALPDVGFLQSYGMTELSPVVTILDCEDHLPEHWASGRLRSAGRPVLLAEVGVVDAQDRLLPPGEAGEIVARGPNVMLGYWNRPELTAEVKRGGWMHTGDIGYFDDDGYLFVVDRLKDMIISGGENVYSLEVENALASHPAVSQCAVFGRPHEHWGEAVHAVATLKPGAEATERELIEHCRGILAHYKCPRTLEIRDLPMPLSGANKISKAALKEELRARERTGEP
ncbi:fatty-acid--CoA ligase [Novosphingobium sediminis]|uniref:Fatty-acid--CoA ligase n=1 Tax=Novosphingobium sediminis TaxID=707214 RepID=A0A512AG46_9SPHN|nr:long-chain fatty acid--CoA ligase [Novosphingobium sediminis]GEN98684.1 fatty-acid--CoA ligase [Novosphingobium sediminis]